MHATATPRVRFAQGPDRRVADGLAGVPPGRRRIYRLGRHWALAVNQKLLAAFGMGTLAWALIPAVAWAVIAVTD
jgi:hypothetical protein